MVSCCFQPSYATDIHSHWKQIFQNLTTQNIFSMLTDENSQYLFTFTWEEQQYNWMVIFIPRVSQSPPYFSQDLKADLDDRKFGEGSIFLKY